MKRRTLLASIAASPIAAIPTNAADIADIEWTQEARELATEMLAVADDRGFRSCVGMAKQLLGATKVTEAEAVMNMAWALQCHTYNHGKSAPGNMLYMAMTFLAGHLAKNSGGSMRYARYDFDSFVRSGQRQDA